MPETIDQDALDKVTYELSQLVDLSNWYFIQTPQANINTVFDSLNTPYSLQEDGGSPYIFIIDKDRKLRGRDDDEDYGVLYGYDSSDIAELADKMKDDVKIVLAEYRLALKKNNADRKK